MTASELTDALQTILSGAQLQTLFQPIVSLSERRLFGYEALTRGPSDSTLHSPIALFAVARQSGHLAELELLSRQNACRRFNQLALDGRLFLNVAPESLLDPRHRPGRTLQILQDQGIAPERVVIELTEQTPIDNFDLLDAALQHYRAMGFSIALDDLGAGYSSLRLWSEMRPDFVKIDRHFIDGLHRDRVKREFISSILQMARASHAQVIAEGIELPEELAILSDMGVDLVQGYLISRPSEQPPREIQGLLPRFDRPLAIEDDGGHQLDSLLIAQPAVVAETPILEVLERFRQDPTLNSLVIIDADQHPMGIVRHHSLAEAMLRPYASDLFSRKPISRLMSDDFVGADIGMGLTQLSRTLTNRSGHGINDDFVLTEQGRYRGVGRVMDLLKAITEQKIEQARQANPLTNLPGNMAIQQRLRKILLNAQSAALCYLDIDQFKGFNDHYGYAQGDDVLLSLAHTLRDRLDPQLDFIGHIGGDDFMLVLQSEDWRERLNRVLEDFQGHCRRFYSAEHLLAGCLEGQDRQGRPQKLALMSLSMGVVPLTAADCSRLDTLQLASLASEAKRQAKAVPGYSLSVLVVPPAAPPIDTAVQGVAE